MFDNHPELSRIGIKIENIDSRYKPLLRMGISIDEMIYLARRLYPLIKGYKRILDLACGNCLIGVILSKLTDAEIHGIDDWSQISKNEVMENVKRDGKMILSDLINFQLPYGNSYFDLVYTVMYLSNIGKEGRIKIANEVRRVLKNNGKFIVIDTVVFRGKIKKDLESTFKLEWYGEENAFSYFIFSPK
ncbi:MAG: class I SAM-dependent methyltransferase [Saccharolobus sp.]